MKIKALSTYLLLLLSLATLFSACEDRLDLSEYDIPEGEGEVKMTFSFSDLASTSLGGSRSIGTAIEDIDNIFIAIYNAKGDKLMDYRYLDATGGGISDPKWAKWDSKTTTTNKPDDGIEKPAGGADMGWADNLEHTTPSVTYTFSMFPFGHYKIYAAANVGNLYKTDLEKIQTADGLKSISYTWKPGNISANNQMFGYFTTTDKQTSSGFEAPIVTVSTAVTDLHAWIKRLASKVTIAYDPSGLKDNVKIYIHSVTLRDIPQTCFLGQQNPQWGENDLVGVHPLALYNRKTVDGGNDASLVANSYFNYDRKGITTGTIDTGNPFRGILLENGYVGQAAVAPNSTVQGSNHAYNAEALYFYENMQGDYEGQTKYNKCMQERGEPDGVGENVTTPKKDEEGNIINDYKDKVSYGTYIEVEAYYDASQNLENPSKGPIKYRFMLGKNTTYNYDAARNHHYKLTLRFNGWANQPDWHIEYDEPDPGLFVPDTWYTSYLYNQRSMLPIKLSGTCTSLTLEITENNWCPYDESTYKTPDLWDSQQNASTITTTWPTTTPLNSPVDNYDFVWARQTMTSGGTGRPALNGRVHPELGFLALVVPGDKPTDIPNSIFSSGMPGADGKDHEFNEGTAALTAAAKVYDNQKSRTFSTQDLEMYIAEDGRYKGITKNNKPGKNNEFQVNPVEDTKGIQAPNQRVVVVPLWTRNKDIITGSGFSGNNPFEAYPRVANIRVTATFIENGSTTTRSANCRVIQVKRITNPKGVWRRADAKGDFHVQLMELDGTNAHSDFKKIVSDGTWKAYIEAPTNASFISLETGDYEYAHKVGKTDTIKGDTGSNVDFVINFKGVGADETKCAVINVLYNGEQSFHKILVRQGYENPITMGGSTWSSYSVYGCTRTNANDGRVGTYNVELTQSPLAFGTFFRRERLNYGILSNNNNEIGNLGPMKGPNGTAFEIYNTKTKSTWEQIGSAVRIGNMYYNYTGSDSGNGNGTSAANSRGISVWVNIAPDGTTTNRIDPLMNRSMGTFYADGYTYKVPTLKQFKDMAEGCEYAFGVVYGTLADKTETDWDIATGYMDGDNNNEADIVNGEQGVGTRGVIVYNPTKGDQILFPLGKYGMGRRRQYNVINAGSSTVNRGTLWYGDLNSEMTWPNSPYANWFRPIAYNMKIDAGAVYWIDQYVAANGLNSSYAGYPREACFGWDINYMNLDFKNFSKNCALDALPIKLIITASPN